MENENIGMPQDPQEARFMGAIAAFGVALSTLIQSLPADHKRHLHPNLAKFFSEQEIALLNSRLPEVGLDHYRDICSQLLINALPPELLNQKPAPDQPK